jgi:hypothetical protein
MRRILLWPVGSVIVVVTAAGMTAVVDPAGIPVVLDCCCCCCSGWDVVGRFGRVEGEHMADLDLVVSEVGT